MSNDMPTGAKLPAEVWLTKSFAPLPSGWVNVWGTDDKPERSPCPGVLVQELVESQDKPMTPPYQARVVFADYDEGHLDAACDIGGYITTVFEPRRVPGA